MTYVPPCGIYSDVGNDMQCVGRDGKHFHGGVCSSQGRQINLSTVESVATGSVFLRLKKMVASCDGLVIR